MKNLFKLFLITSLSVLFVACVSGSKDVEKMYFYVKDDAAVADEYYAYSYLTVIPNHEESVLNVDFSIVYTSEEQENYQTSAEVAEPYFTKFLDLSELILSEELVSKEVDESVSLFQVTLDDKSNNRYEYETSWDDDSLEHESFKSFYLELVDMLTVEVPV